MEFVGKSAYGRRMCMWLKNKFNIRFKLTIEKYRYLGQIMTVNLLYLNFVGKFTKSSERNFYGYSVQTFHITLHYFAYILHSDRLEGRIKYGRNDTARFRPSHIIVQNRAHTLAK